MGTSAREKPNIIVTGTPGVGKTSHCELLAQSTGLKHLSINHVVKERGCHEGWDKEHKSWIVNEDELLDSIEKELYQGGYILDWHACDLFPESWVDLVIVLRTDSKHLYDRLKARDYPEQKLQENIDTEIMEVLLDEARNAYDQEIVIELQSNEPEDLETNVERIGEWLENWRMDKT
ncbi:MAG: hypothetical protein Q9191_000798 [Dirinaria sp. TL-2023a]